LGFLEEASSPKPSPPEEEREKTVLRHGSALFLLGRMGA